jgi:thiosulfate/3-mercaptopyruvate sulfurtransferase
MSELPPLVDAAWLQEHLAEEDLLVGDVRGPNAHQRGHLPGSIPLVLGSPPPLATRETVAEFATEVQRRLGRHGVTGEERLVLYDRGDCVGAAASAQAALAAGHPRVSVLAGGVAAWPGELELGPAELQKTKVKLEPRLDAVPTWEELRDRLHDERLTILDVRGEDEYTGRGGYPCDPRQGHIPGARLLEVERLFAGPGRPHEAWGIRELTGLPEGAAIVAYCHSGSRSAVGALALRSAGYDARNYPGSWHEWSRHDELPAER